MIDFIRALLGTPVSESDDRGASAVEYGLLIAGIAALIVVVVFAFGGTIKGAFTDTSSCISAKENCS